MSRYQQQFTNFLDCFITKVEPAKPETSDCFITKIEPAKRHKQFHQKLGAIKVEQPETWSAYRKEQPATWPAIRTFRKSVDPKSRSSSVPSVRVQKSPNSQEPKNPLVRSQGPCPCPESSPEVSPKQEVPRHRRNEYVGSTPMVPGLLRPYAPRK